MRKKISSEFTYLYKSSWIGFLIGILVILFVSDLDVQGKMFYSLAFAIGAFLFFSISSELKDVVEIDEFYMYVTNRRGTIQFPFSIIKDVREIFPNSIQGNAIIVELRVKTKFGLTIKFVPYFSLFWPISQHPVVGRIKKLAGLDKSS